MVVLQLQLKAALGGVHYSQKLAKACQSVELANYMKALSYTVEDQVWISRRLKTDAYNKELFLAKLPARPSGPFAFTKLVRKHAVKQAFLP